MPGHTPLPATPIDLPLLPLRDVVVFPHMVIPLFVGRPKSIKALEAAMSADRRIMLVAQKAAAKDDPLVTDMFDMGCVSTILQMLKLPDGTVKVLVEGQQRAMVKHIEDGEAHFVATVTPVETPAEPEAKARNKASEVEALRRAVMQQFDQYVKLNKKIPPEILTSIAGIDDPGRLADTIAAHLPLKLDSKQAVLDLASVRDRLENLFEQIEREVDILNVDKKIRGRVKRQMEKNQRDFYLNEQVKAIQKELGEGDAGVEAGDRVELELEVELELLLDRLADVDLVEALDVRHAVEEQDPLDELVGVLHLVDRLLADLGGELVEAPVGVHLGVDEVLVDGRQLRRQDVVERFDDLVVALHCAGKLARSRWNGAASQEVVRSPAPP